MRKTTCRLICLFLLTVVHFGRGQSYRDLSTVGTVRLTESQDKGIAVVEPIKCSPDGEIYVRFARGTPQLGVSVVSSDKKQLRQVSAWEGPEFNGSYLLDFTPGPNHSVTFLIGKRDAHDAVVEHEIVTSLNGRSTVSKVDSPSGVSLRQIAALGPDSFVIAGFSSSTGKGERPYLGVFDERGGLLKSVTLSGDFQPEDEGRLKTMDEPINPFASWLELSTLQTSNDGRVFLMRRSPEGPVFVISPSGTTERIKLHPPDNSASLASVKVWSSRIAAEYYVRAHSSKAPRIHYLTITDIASGELQQTIRYVGSQSTGVGMVCYEENIFVFLSQDPEGYLQIMTATSH